MKLMLRKTNYKVRYYNTSMTFKTIEEAHDWIAESKKVTSGVEYAVDEVVTTTIHLIQT